MPQISADTVAEHRAQQQEALLDAAEAILRHGAGTLDEVQPLTVDLAQTLVRSRAAVR
jgi:hypothetical protein